LVQVKNDKKTMGLNKETKKTKRVNWQKEKGGGGPSGGESLQGGRSERASNIVAFVQKGNPKKKGGE